MIGMWLDADVRPNTQKNKRQLESGLHAKYILTMQNPIINIMGEDLYDRLVSTRSIPFDNEEDSHTISRNYEVNGDRHAYGSANSSSSCAANCMFCNSKTSKLRRSEFREKAPE